MFSGVAHASEFRALISQEILQGLESGTSDDVTESLAVVQAAYTDHLFEPIWTRETGPKPKALALAESLRALEFDGLEPADYGVETINQLLAADDAESWAKLEIALSLALVQAASDLASGRLVPRQVYPSVYVFPQDVDKADVLQRARTAPDINNFMQGFQPAQDNYHRLKIALLRYRHFAKTGWPLIPKGPSLKLGDRGARVKKVRERLTLWGDLDPDADGPDPTAFDAPLDAAVKRFQQRHGLKVDGVIGRASLGQLNVTATTRVQQILLNMERRRWMVDKFEPRYVFVNLADFFLKVVDTDGDREKTVFTTQVVVGKPYHQTPEFSHAIRYLVLNPYWNVPISIARNEIFPKIQEDPGYLARKNFVLLSDWGKNAYEVDPYSVDWHSMTPREFGFRLRQGPGPGNALGRIKFMFPNRHNIYLHDTPSRSLFERTRRTFSHGCIRVKDPAAFAEVLLAWQSGWSRGRIDRSIDEGRRRVVSLAEPIPVHLAYITAWANKDGTVHFRDDVYGRDKMLARALLGRELGQVSRQYMRARPLVSVEDPNSDMTLALD